MALSALEQILNFLKYVLPLLTGICGFIWLFFTCFKIDSDNKLKGNYFIWKNLDYIKDDPELKARITEYIESTKKIMITDNICKWDIFGKSKKRGYEYKAGCGISGRKPHIDNYCHNCGKKIEVQK